MHSIKLSFHERRKHKRKHKCKHKRFVSSESEPYRKDKHTIYAGLRVESETGLFHWTNITACVGLALRPVFTQRKRTQAYTPARGKEKKSLCLCLFLRQARFHGVISALMLPSLMKTRLNLLMHSSLTNQKCEIYVHAVILCGKVKNPSCFKEIHETPLFVAI